MNARHILPILLGVVLLTLSTTSAFADPLVAGGNVAVGDQYTVTTVSGTARAIYNGHVVTGPANLQLQLQVTFVGPHNIVYKVLSGTFQVSYKTYTIDVGHWRGDYNRDTHTAFYQGPATAPDGNHGYFVLFGQDTRETLTGTHMHIVSDFRGEYGVLWHVALNVFRYQLI